MTIKIMHGDCLHKLSVLDDKSIDCVISSPPYFNLRDYRVNGQFGHDKTVDGYVKSTVKVFATMRPLLKDTATIWWNVGDVSIAKNLMMIPNKVAIALQDAGWYIRSEIIWHKTNPMPESVKDRPTAAHEKVWLITKKKNYFYDADAIKEVAVTKPKLRNKLAEGYQADFPKRARFSKGARVMGDGMRNKRNVWTLPTAHYNAAHFATFPTTLVKPCVLAGCPVGGTVLDPFAGSGTVAVVAAKHNRNSIMIELNSKYIDIMRCRIDKELQ